MKANIGHCKSVAAFAGAIHAIVAIEKQENPPLKSVPWNSVNRIAAVNSFGYGGSNGILFLQNYQMI